MSGAGVLRGYRGTAVAPTTLDDESYLEAVQALRGIATGPLRAHAERDANASVDVSAVPTGAPSHQRIAVLPSVSVRDRVLRTSQDMLWRRVAATYERRRDELVDLLDPDASGAPAVPSYLGDYHLQPGGYHGDALAGLVYHYGTKIFWLGANDRDEAKTAIVESVPAPADGEVGVVVELACSVGQSTTAFKARFADAEVWGIDPAAPMIRYARTRAHRMGVDVRFAQCAAEDLAFGDASVDLVFASLLFHEVPVEVARRIVEQVARVLRPGGVFVVNDMNPDALTASPWSEYERWWDTTHNSEPYEYAFLGSDFGALLGRHFRDVEFAGRGINARWTATR